MSLRTAKLGCGWQDDRVGRIDTGSQPTQLIMMETVTCRAHVARRLHGHRDVPDRRSSPPFRRSRRS
eukprot:443802-Rhodomonas_salina.1